MQDTQGLPDHRGVELDQVGLCNFRYPIVVLDRHESKQHTTATIKVSVSLPHHFRGTHMSRFVEILDENRGEITVHTMPGILRQLRQKLESEAAQMEVNFTYFLERRAPVTGVKGLVDYECGFRGESSEVRGDSFVVVAEVPVTSLCPCSKAISDYGAHNQRGRIRMSVRTQAPAATGPEFVWIEELVELAERSGSAPVYALLKRADERHVTMQAFDNPVFVEDMVRNVAVGLRSDPRVAWFEVEAVNEESIHNHSVFARTTWSRADGE
jgi:GTP cyclohydrolase I